MKKGFIFLFSISLMVILFSNVYAQSNNTSVQFQPNVTLQTKAGITPDSSFYFIQRFLDIFSNDLKLREEKIAEIKIMVKQGKMDAAKIALKEYLKHANALEKQVGPDDVQNINMSSSAIYNTLQDFQGQIPSNETDNFNQIVDKEKSIVTASAIASRIKDLCQQLSKVDPIEYSRSCKISNDSPDWKKKLDQNLTVQQKADVEKFGSIMQECFKTSGQTCRCNEIPFKDFAATCLIGAPLAVACNINGNESACQQLNNLKMPDLPPYLQSTFNNIQGGVTQSEFNSHFPQECKAANITNSNDCMKFMIQTHAPTECQQALINANVQNPKDAQDICNKIMFQRNAPDECVKAGINDAKECQKLMFKLKAPQSCVDAGLTGQYNSDSQKCNDIMMAGNGQQQQRGSNCVSIKNSEERLRCYDAAARGVSQGQMGQQGQWPQQCQDAKAFTINSCQEIIKAFSQGQFNQSNRQNQNGQYNSGQYNQYNGSVNQYPNMTPPNVTTPPIPNATSPFPIPPNMTPPNVTVVPPTPNVTAPPPNTTSPPPTNTTPR